ncbi:MAG: nucleotidyl transferase AbiEii/AbiGii toxin family protein [Sediminibacterium magnilacihabitans]|jgi:predicted nucleotidyltransferase component of viral defense system|nr:nucleotidyl transferase AbiEii/AbiGii toxin family protein [Sediminibacterium magnilacihabitans]PQV57319.1 nucleotidyltransferase AbiEii toxin of type IV toxin-antitoxin system [Sediminibacterium magnilacihabitans]
MKWLELSDDRKQLVLDQASAKLSAPKNALEKDWWVTVALRAIFNTPFAKDIVFKGGTSLSKSWQLISRFSEDIDLAINREALGFGGELTYSQIKKLKRKGVEFTITEHLLKEVPLTALQRLGFLLEVILKKDIGQDLSCDYSSNNTSIVNSL